ncbi:MAG: hypothetical protein HUK21_13015 [Fibrobacteraceae bacterium]|nr:hypothetical protein [Fibrobacteraceae bacterium]
MGKIGIAIFLLVINAIIGIVIGGLDDLFDFFFPFVVISAIEILFIVVLDKKNTYQATLDLFSSKNSRDDSDEFDEALGLKEKEKTFDEWVKK